MTPNRPPDAFAGVPCVISGRYRCDTARPAATLHVEAGTADGSFATELPALVAQQAKGVQKIWARAVVRDLEDQYASGGADHDLTGRLVAHSIRFGVLSRFTAFVAIDPERPEDTDTGPLDEVVQPVEMPSGWASGSVARFAPAPMTAGAGYSLNASPPAAVMTGFAGSRAMPPPPASVPPAPRPLQRLLKQVEKATQVRRSGLDRVLQELQQHRDAASDPDLHAALIQLCNALTRFLKASGQAQAHEVLVAVEAVKRLLGGADRGRRASKLRFWE